MAGLTSSVTNHIGWSHQFLTGQTMADSPVFYLPWQTKVNLDLTLFLGFYETYLGNVRVIFFSRPLKAQPQAPEHKTRAGDHRIPHCYLVEYHLYVL